MLGFDKPILLDTAPQILLIQETSDVIQVILDLYQLLQYLRFSLSACAASLQEKGSDEVVFKAMGRAINKTVTIVELIKVMCLVLNRYILFVRCLFPFLDQADKIFLLLLFQRRIVGLHQNTTIGSTDITDIYEPLEEGLDT